MAAVETASPMMGTAAACDALGVPRASVYRRRQPARPRAARPAPPRALDARERQTVLDTLHSERFIDQAPAQVHATLLDEGTYLCAPRTMYRLLDTAGEVKERRDQVRRPHYAAPELLATRPNEVWSWDITKLLGPAKWTYFYLYVILDIFSRYVVGWMLAPRESAALAERLIAATCAKQGIEPGSLTVHAGRARRAPSPPRAAETLNSSKNPCHRAEGENYWRVLVEAALRRRVRCLRMPLEPGAPRLPSVHSSSMATFQSQRSFTISAVRRSASRWPRPHVSMKNPARRAVA